jgi:hypothetical protein
MKAKHGRILSSLKEGKTRILDLNTGKLGTLESNLAMQITVDFDDGTFKWFMKQYIGNEWDVVKEGEG